MDFYFLDGYQITEACAKRWEEQGWIKLEATNEQTGSKPGPNCDLYIVVVSTEYYYTAVAQ